MTPEDGRNTLTRQGLDLARESPTGKAAWNTRTTGLRRMSPGVRQCVRRMWSLVDQMDGRTHQLFPKPNKKLNKPDRHLLWRVQDMTTLSAKLGSLVLPDRASLPKLLVLHVGRCRFESRLPELL
jgi:hypothetical protein